MTVFVDEGVGRRLVPYAEGLALQTRLHDEVVSGVSPGTVVLLEHEPVYTAGRRTEPGERPADGTPVVDVDRGGKITWHGPGQLVGYPIVRLPDPIDVVAYVRSLEAMLLAVTGAFGIDAHRVEGRSGVWVTEGVRESKLAAIGIRVAGGSTTHGFALNCSNSLEAYSAIVACGIRDAGVTTMSRVLGRRVEPVEVLSEVRSRFVDPGLAGRSGAVASGAVASGAVASGAGASGAGAGVVRPAAMAGLVAR